MTVTRREIVGIVAQQRLNLSPDCHLSAARILKPNNFESTLKYHICRNINFALGTPRETPSTKSLTNDFYFQLTTPGTEDPFSY
ncbi:hypothetical protein TNCT_24911 [Trichonephila clavata]|uniref:Uncharacterized protein n=1 Tax=Trichonephila clavata TaxID=2740835 RepID=A0A8X6HFJ7_TRICU|nr:hypothetical protein TNCT_24911 [Trichonephila clavata]